MADSLITDAVCRCGPDFIICQRRTGKNGPYFWGLACGVPAFIWSLVGSVRWLVFITQHIRADAWNQRREEVILQETRRGRRALQILSFSVQTALNGDSVAETTTAFLARQQVLNTYADLRGEDTVRRSVIPVLTNKPVTGRLSEIISRLFIDIRPQLFLLPLIFISTYYWKLMRRFQGPP